MLQLNLDCHKCSEAMRLEQGCDKDGQVFWNIDGVNTRRCPIKLIDTVSWRLIKAYGFWKQNILPNNNGWLEETEKFTDAVLLIDSEFNKITNRKMRKTQKSAKVKHGRH